MRVQGKGESQAEIDSGCGWKGQRRKETEKKCLQQDGMGGDGMVERKCRIKK